MSLPVASPPVLDDEAPGRMSELGSTEPNRIRIGAVNYLNSKPLIEGLRDDLSRLAPDAELVLDYPSRLADDLDAMIDAGFEDFARRFRPILDEFQKVDVKFALEVHPTEIAFDIASAERAVEALDGHPAFGFNYDPRHLGYQGVDYVEFIYRFPERIFHVHMKDVAWSMTPTEAGVFGGHTAFGDRRRYWDFRSLGRGNIDFEEIIRALNRVSYQGPLSVEWEDGGMDREHGAADAADIVKEVDFETSATAIDAAFSDES